MGIRPVAESRRMIWPFDRSQFFSIERPQSPNWGSEDVTEWADLSLTPVPYNSLILSMQGSPEAATSETESMTQLVSVEKLSTAFAKVRREVSEDEFTAPGVARILLDQISDLRQRVHEETKFRALYYDADKERAIMREKLKLRLSSEIISGIVLTFGSLLIGFSPMLWKSPPYGVVALSSGLALVLVAILTPVIASRK